MQWELSPTNFPLFGTAGIISTAIKQNFYGHFIASKAVQAIFASPLPHTCGRTFTEAGVQDGDAGGGGRGLLMEALMGNEAPQVAAQSAVVVHSFSNNENFAIAHEQNGLVIPCHSGNVTLFSRKGLSHCALPNTVVPKGHVPTIVEEQDRMVP